MEFSSNVFDPQSPLARAILDLFNITLVVCAVIFVLVAALTLYCIIRFRGKGEQANPVQVRGHKTLEIIWTITPLLVLVYLFTATLRTMKASDPPPANSEPEIIVIGHQFWWEVRYPKTGIITANEIHVPIGRKVLFQVETADVIHDFWIPQMGRKIDMLPDRKQQIYLQANKAGMYQGVCAEFCGLQHAWMRLLVHAQTDAEFETWQKQQIEAPPAPDAAAAKSGAELFRQMTCVNCHAIRGTTPSVQFGPDLTHVATRRTLGAGVVTNTPENLARWLRNPQLVKPGNAMPNMHLTDNQVNDLLAYLSTLK